MGCSGVSPVCFFNAENAEVYAEGAEGVDRLWMKGLGNWERVATGISR